MHEPDAQSKSYQKRDKRKHPNQETESFGGRCQQHPLAIFRYEIIFYFLGRFTRLELLSNNSPHLLRHLRRRVGDGKILANDAAQLGCNLAGSILQIGSAHGEKPCCEQEQGNND